MRSVKFQPGKKISRLSVPTTDGWKPVAENVLSQLKPGSILAVQGDLGAGKTTFIQALAKELGIKRFVPSPTFSLMRSYKVSPAVNGIKRLIHVDAYRLKNARELMVLDLDEELSDGGSVLVLEWPEKVEAWLAARMKQTVKLSIE